MIATTLVTARAALMCPTCGFLVAGMPWHEAVKVGRCLACGIGELHVEPRADAAPRMARWGEFPI